MKILLLNQVFYPDPVATAQHTRDLAVFLQQQGHTVTVLAGDRNYEHRDIKYPKRETYQGITIRRVGSTGLGKRNLMTRLLDALTFDALLLWALLRIPRQDVVISFTSPPLIGLFGTLFCWLRGGRSVQWLMDVNPDAAIAVGYLKPKAALTRLLLALFELTLRRSEKIVVLDRWMRDRILERGATFAQIAIVPPWPVQRLETPPPNAGESFRTSHGLQGKYVVLYSGNHSIVHPLGTLLEAAVRLKDDPSIVFLFIGNGLRVVDVTAAVQRHRLTNVVQLPPQPREQLQESLGAGHLHVVIMGNKVTGLVHASKIYGVLATGRPYVYIGPEQSHGADLLNECPYGFRVDHGDVDGIIRVIQRARSLTPNQLSEYARENVGFVSRQYSAEKSLQIFYSEVIQPMEDNTAIVLPVAPDAAAARR